MHELLSATADDGTIVDTTAEQSIQLPHLGQLQAMGIGATLAAILSGVLR